MNELKVIKGQNKLLFEGITNMDELKDFAIVKSDEYSNIIVTEENFKICEETIKEIKPYRTEVKKYRAAVNKELKNKTSDILAEIDKVTNIFTSVIDPVEDKINEYKESIRLEKLKKKQDFFSEDIKKLNNELLILSETIPFTHFTPIEFDEGWVNKKNADIVDELNKIVEMYKIDIRSRLDRVKAIKSKCELLKINFDLKSDIDYTQLKADIYSENWEEMLEELAARQQEIELSAILKEQEEQKIKQEIKENKKKEEKIKSEDIKEKLESHINIRLFLNEKQNLAFKKFIKENDVKFEMLEVD